MDVLNVEILEVDNLETEIIDVTENVDGEIKETEEIEGGVGDFFGYVVRPTVANYIHKQGVAADVWYVNHNLGKYCSVMVVDSAKQVVCPDIVYLDKNTVKIISTGAFTGWAYCN